MIDAIIFFGHTIFAVYAFARSYQVDGLLQAFLNVAFIIILFAVGWTISDLLVGFVIPVEGYTIATPHSKAAFALLKMTGVFVPGSDGYSTVSPKDTISLILLTVIEIFFYRFYFRSTKALKRA